MICKQIMDTTIGKGWENDLFIDEIVELMELEKVIKARIHGIKKMRDCKYCDNRIPMITLIGVTIGNNFSKAAFIFTMI